MGFPQLQEELRRYSRRRRRKPNLGLVMFLTDSYPSRYCIHLFCWDYIVYIRNEELDTYDRITY